MQENNRRRALKTLSVLGAAAITSQGLKGMMPDNPSFSTDAGSNGVVLGKSNKQEILYHKTPAWEKFYEAVW